MAADPVGSPVELYKKGNEHFVSEDYDRAVELYMDAIAHDPSITECYAACAQAHIKKERYHEAKKIADRGIDILRGVGPGDDRSATETKKCLQRAGVASFHLGKYKEAKNSFTEAGKLDDSDKGLRQWVSWCDEKISKFGDDATKKSADPATTLPEKKSVVNPVPCDKVTPETSPSTLSEKSQSSEPTKPTPESSEPSESTPQPMPTPKIKHDWYQTETHVIVEVRIKSLKPGEVTVNFNPTALSVTAKLSSGSDYSLELDLAHPTVPEQSSFRILSTKLEIKLRKTEGVRWTVLEGDGVQPVPGLPLQPTATGGVKAPYASGRDWNKVEKLLEKEADEKKEGEAALNEMFQKIYADANDEVRKAMNKSFMESGGTVLSTNWSEIGKEKVDVKPPDGMEFKKWD
jgi:suppressor of G2 allele of SKP1